MDEARLRWAEQDAAQRTQRRGQILDVARTEFAQRGFDATTVRDIADAAGLKASNLYRYFESKDSMIREILGHFSEQLLAAYRAVIGAGAATVPTVDAILWLLNQAGRHFSREVEILQTFSRLLALGVADAYQEGAQARLALLSDLIVRGVAAGAPRHRGPRLGGHLPTRDHVGPHAQPGAHLPAARPPVPPPVCLVRPGPLTFRRSPAGPA